MALDTTQPNLSKDDIETEGRKLFYASLPTDIVDVSPFDGKKKGYDEHIEIVKPNKSKTGKTFLVQSKATIQETMKSHSCKKTFLDACMVAREPVILILVNIATRQLYWEHIDPVYVTYVLSHKKTVNFKNTISLDDREGMIQFINTCEEICDGHHSLFEQELDFQKRKQEGKVLSSEKSPFELAARARYEEKSDSLATSTKAELHEAVEVVDSIRKSAQSMADRLLDKLIEYQAALYLLYPVYLNGKHDGTKSNIRDIIGISPAEESVLLKYIFESGFGSKVGNIIDIKDMKAAKACARVVIENKKIDIDKLLADFK